MRNMINTVLDAARRPDSLGSKLKIVIDELPPGKVTLAEIRDLLGQDGLLLFNAFLSVIFLIPVSIPGVSTVFGAAILMIAVSRLFNCRLWLPKRFLERQFPRDQLCTGLDKSVKWFRRLECISCSHRLGRLASGKYLGILNNCALILAAGLLMAPFGLIPFSNTLPAVAILFLTLGFLQRDGLCVILGHAVNMATIVYLGLLLGSGGAAFLGIVERIK